MKIVLLLAVILLCNETIFSQWAGNEDALHLKELKLTRHQKKEIRKIDHDAAAEISVLKTNADSEENSIKISKVYAARIKKNKQHLDKRAAGYLAQQAKRK